MCDIVHIHTDRLPESTTHKSTGYTKVAALHEPARVASQAAQERGVLSLLASKDLLHATRQP